MDTNKKEYHEIHKKNLADSLNFLGFRYYKFTNFLGQQVYSFKNTEKFNKALTGLLQLRAELNN
ncbi:MULTISPECIES: hypothetical protein [Clostridium]|uniref:hypothetical protein n=1 Tax=Clostridium TaxID=1485 RepID=UPI000825D49A|nr:MULTISPECIES: hypothetical protein [Clostridium]PJI09956.1 hypothetical protein CUB90_19695 [Clostridium sp. CT7]